MTDKEIIAHWDDISRSMEQGEKSGAKITEVRMSKGLAEATYNLIKRLKRESNSYRNKAKGQKGELARLNKQVADLTEKLEALGDPLQDAQYKIAEQQAEIERLRSENVKLHTIIPKMLVEAKSEAIKEFAEKFYSMIDGFGDYDTLHIYEIKDRIDIIEEMVGDIPKLEHNSLCETDTYEVKGDDVE
jgi:chromosome segregation ATPase